MNEFSHLRISTDPRHSFSLVDGITANPPTRTRVASNVKHESCVRDRVAVGRIRGIAFTAILNPTSTVIRIYTAQLSIASIYPIVDSLDKHLLNAKPARRCLTKTHKAPSTPSINSSLLPNRLPMHPQPPKALLLAAAVAVVFGYVHFEGAGNSHIGCSTII